MLADATLVVGFGLDVGWLEVEVAAEDRRSGGPIECADQVVD